MPKASSIGVFWTYRINKHINQIQYILKKANSDELAFFILPKLYS